jgi:hypothetical protein
VTREEALTQLYSLVAAAPAASAPPDAATPQQQTTAQANAVNPSRVGDQLALITQQLDLLRIVQQAQADAVAENTKALSQSSAASKVGDVAKSAATSFLGGFGLSPIVSGLLKLFGGGGGDSAAPAPLVKYAAPASMQVSAGLSNGQLTEAGYGAGDRVRALAPNVTVQVQAMDTQSFLDRSDDIARAVRQAMLESHAINDVVAEL